MLSEPSRAFAFFVGEVGLEFAVLPRELENFTCSQRDSAREEFKASVQVAIALLEKRLLRCPRQALRARVSDDNSRDCRDDPNDPKRHRFHFSSSPNIPLCIRLWGCAFSAVWRVPGSGAVYSLFLQTFPHSWTAFTPPGPPSRLEDSGPCASFLARWLSFPAAGRYGRYAGRAFPQRCFRPRSVFLSSQYHEEKHAWPLKKK